MLQRLFFRHKGLNQLVAANLVNNVITFGSILILGRLVAPERFGVFTISFSIMSTVAIILDFGINIALVRMYNRPSEGYSSSSYIRGAIALRLLSSLVMLVLAYPVAQLLDGIIIHLPGSSMDLLAALMTAIVFSWWTLLRSINQAKSEHENHAFLTTLFGVVRLIIIGVLFSFDMATPMSFLLGLYCFSPLVILVAELAKGLLIHQRRSCSKWENSPPVELLTYGKWPFLSTLLFPLVSNVPLWILGNEKGMDMAGAYGVGVFFANALAPLREALRIFLFPKIIRFESDEKAGEFMATWRRYFWLVLPITMLIAVISVGAQELLYSGAYVGAGLVTACFVLAQVITMYTVLIGMILHYLGRPEIDVYVNIFRVSVSLVLAMVLIPSLGVIGAALAASISILTGEFIIYRYVSIKLSSS